MIHTHPKSYMSAERIGFWYRWRHKIQINAKRSSTRKWKKFTSKRRRGWLKKLKHEEYE